MAKLIHWSVVCLLVFALDATVYGQYNPCDGQPDKKIVEIYCWGYRECEHEMPVPVSCPQGQVFERDSMACKNLTVAKTACCPCLQRTTCPPPKCKGTGDGLYTDDLRCQTYFKCVKGELTSPCRQYCPAPLVFNSKLQLCDWKYNVPPPCGTALPLFPLTFRTWSKPKPGM